MNRCSIWNRLVFVLNLYQQAFKSYGLLSRVLHKERIMMVGNMQLLTAFQKLLCKATVFLKWISDMLLAKWEMDNETVMGWDYAI